MFESRAQNLGVKPKVLIARTRRELDHLRSRIDALATPWAEIDNSIDGAKSELMVAFEKFEQHVKSAEQYLSETAGS